MTSVLSPFGPVEADLERLRQNLTRLVSAKHPILAMAAEHLFFGGRERDPASHRAPHCPCHHPRWRDYPTALALGRDY
jgi:hypothetical protein